MLRINSLTIEARLGQSQSPGCIHQIVDFADHGGPARTQVLLHAESCKKGQDQFRKGVRIHLWALDLNILGEELLQFASASAYDANSFRRQYRKLTHGADSKTSLLSLHAAWSHLEESLDVVPAQGLGCQQSLLLETFQVVLKDLYKQILFMIDLGVEPELIDSGSHFQFVKTGLSKPAPPKNRQRLL